MMPSLRHTATDDTERGRTEQNDGGAGKVQANRSGAFLGAEENLACGEDRRNRYCTYHQP